MNKAENFNNKQETKLLKMQNWLKQQYIDREKYDY